MSKTLVLSLAAWGCAAVVVGQTADEVVARNVAARGGAEAWRAVQSMKTSGRMDVGRGMLVPFRLELKRPRRMRLEFEFGGATAVQTYDGTTGWKLMPFLGRSEAIPLSEEELRSAAGQVELDGPLIDYKAKGNKVELLGRESVEGREAFKLKLTLKSGAVRQIYVDAESGLETKLEATHKVRGAEKRLDTYFRDYRTVEGLAIPHVVESRVEGAAGSHKLAIESVQFNAPVADKRFAKPADTKPAGRAAQNTAR